MSVWCGSSPASTPTPPGCSGPETEFDPAADAKPGVVGHSPAGRGWRSLAAQSTDDAPWLLGLNRLSDPSALSRFVVSRTLYRRLGRYAWWLLVPFAVAGLLRVAVTPWVSGHLGSGLPARAIRHAHRADLGDQIVIAALVSLVVLAVLALVLGLLSRRMWSILGGGALETVQSEAGANDTARDDGRRLVGRGYAGLITAATFQSELTHLGVGFYANVGATAEVVEEHRGRLGLPPVFLQNQRVSWVELETGAELHVRMLVARNELPSPNVLERLITRGRHVRSLHPSLVASYPIGESWPPAPDLRQAHRRTRRVRRWASAAILFAGVVDLIDAITPPLRGRLHVVLEFLPLRASVAAGALIAMAGLALVALGRGILRGQRRAWRVSVVLLSGTIVLHLVAGADFEESLFAVGGPGAPPGQPSRLPVGVRLVIAPFGAGGPGRRAWSGSPSSPRPPSSSSSTSGATTTPPSRGGRRCGRCPNGWSGSRPCRCPGGPTAFWPRRCWPSGCPSWPSPCSC